MEISFHFQTTITLRHRLRLKRFIDLIFKKEGVPFEGLDIIFCSDPYLLQINKDFLQHDYYTDIITFDLSEPGSSRGEIYISVDRTRENAKLYNVTQEKELHRVIFHGILHLCGYKDKSVPQQKHMRSLEDVYLNQYFVPRGT
jgi:probable rRNA maturation factor